MNITITSTRTDAGQAPGVVSTTFQKDIKSEVTVDTGITTRQDIGGAQTTSDTVGWEVEITG